MLDVASKCLVDIPDNFPWPVIWLLCRYSRKHRFVSSSLPCEDHVLHDVVQFERKQRWSCALSSNTERNALDFTRIPHKPTNAFTGSSPPELNAWLAELRGIVSSELSSLRRMRRSQTSILPLTIWAKSSMTQLGLVAIPNDKEFGLTVVPLAWQQAAHEEILARPCYQCLPADFISRDSMIRQYCKLCKRIADIDADLAKERGDLSVMGRGCGLQGSLQIPGGTFVPLCLLHVSPRNLMVRFPSETFMQPPNPLLLVWPIG